MVTTLMMSAKMANLGLLKTEVLWNKGYDVIIYVFHVTNKILSSESNYVVNAVIKLQLRKFGNSNISMREVITTINL